MGAGCGKRQGKGSWRVRLKKKKEGTQRARRGQNLTVGRSVVW
jgi:hypothetical protein